MDKKHKLTIAALLTFGILGAGFVSAFPMGFGGFNKELTAEELEALAEERQKMIDAIENEDYETWKNPLILSIISNHFLCCNSFCFNKSRFY